jgi:hypothetical protein
VPSAALAGRAPRRRSGRSLPLRHAVGPTARQWRRDRIITACGRARTGREAAGQAVNARGDGGEAVGPVVDRVHGGDVGEQRLRGADVGRRLVAPDVLLARLHRHAQRRLVLRVPADACRAPPRRTVGGYPQHVGGLARAARPSKSTPPPTLKKPVDNKKDDRNARLLLTRLQRWAGHGPMLAAASPRASGPGPRHRRPVRASTDAAGDHCAAQPGRADDAPGHHALVLCVRPM